MSGHAGGNSETLKPPVYPEIPNDENVPLTGADQERGADREPGADEGARDNAHPRTSTDSRP